MTDYNTTRGPLILKEYGRNIQKLTVYISQIEDREKRNRYAETLVHLMKQIVPNFKETDEDSQKLWDDLYIMSNFDLDIDGPFPKPDETILNKVPQRLTYRTDEIRIRHYGRNVKLLIDKAVQLTDPEEKKTAIIYIGRLMRTFYLSWNKDLPDEEVGS